MEPQHAPATVGADHPHRGDNASSSSNNQNVDDPQILSPVSTNTAVHKDSALPPIPEPAHDNVAMTPRAGGLKSRLQLSANRLLSLDLLRGLAILIMITCNAQMGDNAFWIVSKYLLLLLKEGGWFRCVVVYVEGGGERKKREDVKNVLITPNGLAGCFRGGPLLSPLCVLMHQQSSTLSIFIM